MNSGNMALKKRFLIPLGIMLAVVTVILSGVISPVALADDEGIVAAEGSDPGDGVISPAAPADEEGITPADDGGIVVAEGSEPNSDKVIRTIMIYMDGANAEEKNPVFSAMLKEYMASKFDRKDFRIIVMTGGSLKWHLEADYLRDKDGTAGTLTEISSEYNQIWEVYGANDGGYLRLLDGDGVSGDGADAKKSTVELMSDPNTLRQFINYAYRIAPAGKYDLILNDHGSGPEGGYGYDDHNATNPSETLSVLELRQAISGSDVVRNEGKFDFIDLDCCVMGNFETALALSDYTDYYLGSADVDPHATVDYTALFDFLATDPNMDAWKLGCKLVDLFVDYYDEHPDKVSVGPSVGYCMVNVNKLKESGIVDKLLTVARQMRAEATAGSFYDEIRVPKDAYHFFLVNLQDFATVMEQLGIGLYESDWQEPGFINAYTQSALEIQNVLHDKDVIYSGHTQRSKQTYAFFGRNDDGSIEIRATKSPTSGLSIFHFANPSTSDVSGEVAAYVGAMKELAESYETGSTERELLETYVQAVLDYELICNAGVAVSNLVENGCAPDEIDYDKVLDYLKSQTSENHVKRGWEYISKAFEASDRDMRAWLGGIIDIQRKEVLDRNKVSLKTESKDGTDCYRIDVKDTPKRVIDVPVLTVTANRVNEMFSKPTRKLFGTRTLSGTEGESADDYMSATNSSYLIPKFDGQWYAVKDADGNLHLASDASDNSVYASFLSMDGKSMGVGELIFDADGNAKSIHLYGNTIPINLDTFQEMVTVALCNNPSSGTEEIIDMFTLQGTNATLVKDSYANLGISDVEVKISIADMYDVQHEIKPLLKLAGAGHVQTYGDKGATQEGNGIVIGTTGQSKRLEQFSVSLPEGTDGSIEYRGHLQGIGWNGWVKDGAPCGTTGESRRIEAVQMTLTGAVANDYSVWYRVHSQTFGWLGWAKDGQAAGTAGQSKRAEAVEVQALPKGQVPGDYVEGQASYIGAATADVHLQGTGWAGSGSALEFGTTGQSRRLEAIGITTPNQPEAGGVTYEVHAQGIGWMGAVADGALAGTTGQSRRLEAVRVSLTGDMANDFSVWYRVHSQTYGWLGWAHDGEEAGTTGLSKRAEAIDVQILPQGQVPGDYDGSAACVTR